MNEKSFKNCNLSKTIPCGFWKALKKQKASYRYSSKLKKITFLLSDMLKNVSERILK
jgi:hypothetical protein